MTKTAIENTNNTLAIAADMAYEGKDITSGEIYRKNIPDELAVINIIIELPVLTGSERQIAWAEDIRTEKIAAAVYELLATVERKGAETAIIACQTRDASINNISDAFALLVKSHPRIQLFLTENSAGTIIDNR